MTESNTGENQTVHVPVLLRETIEALDPKPGQIFLDATVGGGGHSEVALGATGGNLKIVGLDQDRKALERSRARLAVNGFQPILIKANFRDLDRALGEAGVSVKIDRALFDLGLSSDELELSGRGFSFRKDEPLLMTYDDTPDSYAPTAATLVNSLGKDALADIIFKFGEERFARRIAGAIVDQRKKRPIETTGELVKVIEGSVPRWFGLRRIHPATKTFQALRMAVNDELPALEEGLSKAFSRLNTGGRLAVISFHSLEDRLVKNFFKDRVKIGEGKLPFRKPIRPSEEEIAKNARSRSAKLRVIEKIS